MLSRLYLYMPVISCKPLTFRYFRYLIPATLKCGINKTLYSSFSLCPVLYTKDDRTIANDPDLQELIKEMYKDSNHGKKKFAKTGISNNAFDKNLYDITLENEAIEAEFSPDIIYDYDEERILKEKGLWQDIKKKKAEVTEEKVYERGKTGVFDVEEIIELLREQKAANVVAIKVLPECKFVDYLVIATGKSNRHIRVMAEYINKIYKRKKHKSDRQIIIEGKKSDWVAIDMQTIAVHIMTEEIRNEKDIELLWTVGAEYDDHSQEADYNPFSLTEERLQLLKKDEDLLEKAFK